MKYLWFSCLCFIVLQGCIFGKDDSNKENSSITPSSQDAYVSKIAYDADTLLKYLHQRKNFNGNIMVVHNGLKILQKSYGYADFRTKTILTSQSNFRMGSLSKQFTAMAIMMLKESGKLTYEDNIRKFFRGFPYPNITIRQLLNHTSGLPNYGEYFAKVVLTSKYKFTSPTNQDVLLWLINEKPKLYFKSGESWLYTNTGYILLALIVEKVSRKPFFEYLQQRIFGPLDMTSTLVYDKKRTPKIPHRVYGFRQNKRLYDDHLFDRMFGDSNIYSSTEDLYKWDQALRTERLVKQSTLKEAFSPTPYFKNLFKKNYGFGWHLDKAGHTAFHSGSSGGFRCTIMRGLEKDNCVVLLTNNEDGRYENITKTIFDWLD
ncbi:hypothetical protein BKI52_37845 [marine bacterium AO1-C]|nr:hypothetical protein BKI52_37845 [marine bacterium AO1-C]